MSTERSRYVQRGREASKAFVHQCDDLAHRQFELRELIEAERQLIDLAIAIGDECGEHLAREHARELVIEAADVARALRYTRRLAFLPARSPLALRRLLHREYDRRTQLEAEDAEGDAGSGDERSEAPAPRDTRSARSSAGGSFRRP